MVLRARRASYYCPTMAADANRRAKHCNQCQRHAPVSKLPPENLKSISSPWPFRKWGMDIVEKFPMAPGQKVFLLVVTISRSTQPDNRPTDPQIPVDQRNHSLQGPPRDRHRQWTPVHKAQLQGVLQGLGHKAYLRHTLTPHV